MKLFCTDRLSRVLQLIVNCVSLTIISDVSVGGGVTSYEVGGIISSVVEKVMSLGKSEEKEKKKIKVKRQNKFFIK